jgi:hypothetical protein
VFLNYPCISPTISRDNREYTVAPIILVESPKGPSDENPRVYEPLNSALTVNRLSELFQHGVNV